MHLTTLLSFKRLNPDFEIILWTTKVPSADPTWATDEHKTVYWGPDFIDIALKTVTSIKSVDLRDQFGIVQRIPMICKADLVRLWVLSTYGGMWSDMDILWFKPMSELPVETTTDVVTVLKDGATGVMIARKGTEYFRQLLSRAIFRLKDDKILDSYQSIGPVLVMEMGVDPKLISNSYFTSVFSVPRVTFYPVPWNEAHRIYRESDLTLPDEAMGLHWYGGFNLSRHFMNKFPTPDKIRLMDNILARRVVS